MNLVMKFPSVASEFGESSAERKSPIWMCRVCLVGKAGDRYPGLAGIV